MIFYIMNLILIDLVGLLWFIVIVYIGFLFDVYGCDGLNGFIYKEKLLMMI